MLLFVLLSSGFMREIGSENGPSSCPAKRVGTVLRVLVASVRRLLLSFAAFARPFGAGRPLH